MRYLYLLFFSFVVFNASAQQNAAQVIADKPDYLKAAYQQLFEQGRRNAVLNYMTIGSIAFKQGDLLEAKIAFDHALHNIEQVFADNENAEKARSLWYEEAEKDFKGEPYERVMAYYYRALIYLAEGDLGNARATFISGLLQDAYAEEEQHRADFALMHYLAAWCSLKMNKAQLAEVPLANFNALRHGFAEPKSDDNVLVIIETGKSPRKLADGIGGDQLVYRAGKKFKDTQAQVLLNKELIPLLPIEDIYWQASTRGGRAVDRIIKGKVAFAQNTRSAGDILAKTGNTLVEWSALGASGNAIQEIGTVFAVAGLASKMVSLNVETKADTRYWSRLPNTVHIASLKKDNLKDIKADVLDKWGNITKVNDLQTHIFEVDGKYTLIWAKSH
jgi:tetratricopeptide (TPR) repeat protein